MEHARPSLGGGARRGKEVRTKRGHAGVYAQVEPRTEVVCFVASGALRAWGFTVLGQFVAFGVPGKVKRESANAARSWGFGLGLGPVLEAVTPG